MNDSDVPSLAALQRGDFAAWRKAFPHLWPIALRAARHPEACLLPWEAEDVASEAISDLINQIESVRTIEEMPRLLATISRRRAIDLSRRKFADKRTPPERPDEAALAALSPARVELTDIELRELTVLMRQALDLLDAETRELLIEKVAQQLTYQQISARHDLPLGTVCTKVARGLKQLLALLQQNPALMKELRHYLR